MISTHGLVIVVTGVTGVGKTTIADGLAQRLSGRHINLSELAEEWGLTTGWDEEMETAIVDLDGIYERVMRLRAASKVSLIIEGHFAPDVVPPEVASFIFVLRRAPWRLKEELEARGYRGEKVRENIDAELLGVSLVEAIEVYGPERVCEMDTTGRTPEDMVDEALSIIRGDGLCSRGNIDWLGSAEARGLLEGV